MLEKNGELLEDVKAKKLDSNEMADGKFIMMIMIMIKQVDWNTAFSGHIFEESVQEKDVEVVTAEHY